MRPMELPPGRTRVDAREDARTTLVAERVLEARRNRSPDRKMDVEHQLKQARVVGMKARAAQIALQTMQTKIQMLRENAEVFIQTHGQQGYNELISRLLTKMATMGDDDVGGTPNTPVSVGLADLDDVDGSDS